MDTWSGFRCSKASSALYVHGFRSVIHTDIGYAWDERGFRPVQDSLISTGCSPMTGRVR